MRRIAIVLLFPIATTLLTLALTASAALADNPLVPDPAPPVSSSITPYGTTAAGNGVSEVPPGDVICDTTIDFEGQGGPVPEPTTTAS